MPFNFCLLIYFCTKSVTVVCAVVIRKMADAEILQRNRRRNCFATLSFTAQGRSSGV